MAKVPKCLEYINSCDFGAEPGRLPILRTRLVCDARILRWRNIPVSEASLRVHCFVWSQRSQQPRDPATLRQTMRHCWLVERQFQQRQVVWGCIPMSTCHLYVVLLQGLVGEALMPNMLRDDQCSTSYRDELRRPGRT